MVKHFFSVETKYCGETVTSLNVILIKLINVAITVFHLGLMGFKLIVLLVVYSILQSKIFYAIVYYWELTLPKNTVKSHVKV